MAYNRGIMKSPFPGMDPYLERSWGDVHSRLITGASGMLNGILPEDLVARVEERVVVDCVEYARPRAIYPDARVFEDPTAVAPVSSTVTTLTVAEPILLELEVEEHVETFIAILDPSGGRLITVIEFLSPSNKLPGENRDSYRQKRNELSRGGVNLVEIDLIRAGAWRDLLRPMVAPRDTETAYRVITRRAPLSRPVELYPISMRSRLPIIPIPLRPSDPDATLDLQLLLDQVYREGRHNRTRYDESCEPPLEHAHADEQHGAVLRFTQRAAAGKSRGRCAAARHPRHQRRRGS